MEIAQKTRLESVERHVRQFFQQKISDKYTYHNLEHTANVVHAVREICLMENLDALLCEYLQIAAWFHDTGYDQGAEGHEQRGASYAEDFLRKDNCPAEAIELIKKSILATKYPQCPTTLPEKILCDADLSHLGSDAYWDRCGRVRQELALVTNVIMDDFEWTNFELNFIRSHTFHTETAKGLYGKTKQKHIKQLIKRKWQLSPNSLTSDEQLVLQSKKAKKKKDKKRQEEAEINAKTSNKGKIDKEEKRALKQQRLGRGVETMYRTTYRTHVNLSSIADNKANIMLSINAIIVSITVSTLVPNFGDTPRLIIPTCILLLVCLASIVYATLSTMPKVTEGVFTREDIKKKRSNLLFFGNFYNMKMDDFHWGMMEMIKDSDFLYSSMTRDLYFLGKVLAKKYSYLRTCYRIFMYGLIFSVAAFAYAFAIH
ncbi:MAG: Pycsar system effector family protein [Bacteroidota bacterium]